jgi:hypothetical protein
MQQSHTAVVERNIAFDADFATEPYEAGWAAEARWFVRVLGVTGDQPELEVFAQVSPDGLFWCDEGGPGLVACAPGLYTFSLRDFGAWLRLRGRVSGKSASFKLIIYLALKG